ncbi:arginase family protein [Prauserella halophila]|uniref:arginase family protein n=1 Tax=Prauserella halophila TaxID=185641 RepID=UPI0020A2A49F|nr:arginase family protein [Prauserella halophila]MCP2235084.1 arginase [Prauserella halophila]
MEIQAVPQWQGAFSDDAARRLPAGSRALADFAGEVLDAEVREVPVSPDATATVDGVGHRQALVHNRDAVLAALGPGGPVLTVGGDCGVDLVPVGFARRRHGPELTVAWFDAHADCNTTASTPSGAFHGMVLSALCGRSGSGAAAGVVDRDFDASPALERGRAVLVGTRVFDPEERRAVSDGLVRHVPPPADPAAVRDAVAGGPVYLHVDLDVLDPAAFDGTHYREPGGLTVDGLVAAIDAASQGRVVGASLTECATTDPASLQRLGPVVEALGRALESGR